MANTARGEAEFTLGDKSYTVSMNMGVLARLSAALGVKKLDELQARMAEFNLPDLPLIVDAVLKGNGHAVPMQDIEKMSLDDFMQRFIPAFFGASAADQGKGENGSRPPKRQRA